MLNPDKQTNHLVDRAFISSRIHRYLGNFKRLIEEQIRESEA